MSGDSRLIPFVVSQPTNAAGDLYLRDRIAATTTHIAPLVFGSNVEKAEPDAAVSVDGSTLIFPSEGPLVANDTNNASDVFAFAMNPSNLPPPDFAVGISPSSATISRGSSATFSISLQPTLAAFDNPVTLSCSGLPSFATCSFAPGSTFVGMAAPVLTITNTATAAELLAPKTFSAGTLVSWFMGICVFGLVRGRKRRRLLPAWTVGLLLFMILNLVSCGGGSNSPPKPLPITSAVTVVATSGSVQHSSPVTLTVN